MDGLLCLVPLTRTLGNPIPCQCNYTLSPSWFVCVPATCEISALQIRKLKCRKELFVQDHREGFGRNGNINCGWQVTQPILKNWPKCIFILQLPLMHLAVTGQIQDTMPFLFKFFAFFFGIKKKTTLFRWNCYRKYFGFLLFKRERGIKTILFNHCCNFACLVQKNSFSSW